MIAADIGRALLLATIPLAAIRGWLRMEQLYAVTLVVSFLTVFFNVAYQSYLPALVERNSLIDANSKLAASVSVAEVGGLALTGWLVKIFTAPFTILIDALSFAASAVSIGLIKNVESKPSVHSTPGIRREIAEGLRTVWQGRILRALAGCMLAKEFFSGVYGALVVLYMIRDLGFSSGVLGSIWAVGGISSLFGAALAGRVTQRFGIGRAMIVGLAISSLAMFLVPLARGATVAAAMLLIGQQIVGDGCATIFQIEQVSLQQSVTVEGLLGRVNASTEFVRLGATLAGSLVGGWLGGLLGVRLVLACAAAGSLFSTLLLWFSPVRRLRDVS